MKRRIAVAVLAALALASLEMTVADADRSRPPAGSRFGPRKPPPGLEPGRGARPDVPVPPLPGVPDLSGEVVDEPAEERRRLGVAPAAAGVSHSGTYSWWSGTPAWGDKGILTRLWPALDPTPRAGQVTQGYFYAHQFHLMNGGQAGYIGPQTDANGKRINFSIWGATAAQCSAVQGAYCASFVENGTGYQTYIPYTWKAGVYYWLYVVNTNSDGWYDGWVHSSETNQWRHVGRLKVPSNQWLSNLSVTWVEWYYPQPDACWQYPRSHMWFQAAIHVGFNGEHLQSPTVTDEVHDNNCNSWILNSGWPPWKQHVSGEY